MNTLEFLQAILPDEGVHYIALFKEGYKFPAHKAYDDLETMATAIDGMSRSDSLSIYHACASYQTHVIEQQVGDKLKRKYRIPENWSKAKSFWVDIDCGEEKAAKGAGYPTQRDAAKAIKEFCTAVSLPLPMMVNSGYGVHAYWPLTTAIGHEKWRAVAAIFKAVLANVGLLADPTRTADFSSILRPVGSVNRKNGMAKSVSLARDAQPISPKDFYEAVARYAKANNVTAAKETVRKPVNNDLNADLMGGLDNYPSVPVDANVMADKCAQVAAMRDTKGDVGYDNWRYIIGLLTYSENGRELAREWTEEREATGHDSLDWDVRYDTWNAGPTTCAALETCSPELCSGCQFKDKIKTPLVLGRVIPINEQITETVVSAAGVEEAVEIPALISGYQWENNLLSRLLPDKEGVLQVLPFSNILFYPTSRIRAEDGTYRIGMRMHLPNKKVRDFEIPAESMASQTDMLRGLAKYELMQSNNKDAGVHMAAYLRDQLEELKRRVEEVSTMTNFGWKDDGSFLLGDRLYCKDGAVKSVLVSSGAAKFAPAMSVPKGSVKGYADALNFMYNRPQREHWQYAVCSGWGSILTPFCEELFKGLLMALSGGDTGKGKTTACYASLYAFGDAEKMTLKSKDGFTNNALWAFLGVYKNVPVLLDEFTNMDGAEFSNVAYGVSRGEEKVRLTSKGGTVNFADSVEWRLSPFLTGNRDFHGLLATSQANSQAEAVRLIQINIDSYPVTPLHSDPKVEAQLVQKATDALKANSGSAGEAMIRYVVENQEEVAELVRNAASQLAEALPGTKYRFYRSHGACTNVIAKIAKDLGICDFDLDALRDYTITLLSELAETVTTTNSVTSADAFSQMMATLSSRILVTTEFRDKRHKNGPETPRNRVFGDIVGRYILGSPASKEFAGHIILNQKEIRDWCMKNRVDYNAMIAQLEQDGALVKKSDRITITRGTDIPVVQARCIVVDANKLDKDAISLVPPTSGLTQDSQIAV
jgi:hypothetical protein